MLRVSRSNRWTVHVAILALLLKAAVPLLASAAAQVRGQGVAEICELYGVALPGHGGVAAQAPAIGAGMASGSDRVDRVDHAAQIDHADHVGHVGHIGHSDHVDHVDHVGPVGHVGVSRLVPHAGHVASADAAGAAGAGAGVQALVHANVQAAPAGPEPSSESHAPHRADHCALGGLAAFAPPGTPASAFGGACASVEPVAAATVAAAPQDAVARWAARRDHAPPSVA